jgi:hypothetical protein
LEGDIREAFEFSKLSAAQMKAIAVLVNDKVSIAKATQIYSSNPTLCKK